VRFARCGVAGGGAAVGVVAVLALLAGAAVVGEGIFVNNGSPAGEIIQAEIDGAREEYQAAQRGQTVAAN